MNNIIDLMLKRKSIRAYQPHPIDPEVRAQVLQATLRAPTAGNMMLYSIIDITDQAIKDRLAVTCDDQPFIATAPILWLFLADYQRWQDGFINGGVPDICAAKNEPMRQPAEGDLMLACCDALIAAQNAVIAAEALGLGSCYIGDILEHYEEHRDMFHLPKYTLPVCLLCFGYPTSEQQEREQSTRFDQRYIVFENRYRPLDPPEFEEMTAQRHKQIFKDRPEIGGSQNIAQFVYMRKFSAAFTQEMNRSVRAMLTAWNTP